MSTSLPVAPHASEPLSALPRAEEPSWQLVKRVEINPHEVEDASAQAVEVSVLWQRSVLHVTHLDEGASFTFTAQATKDPSRFVVDAEALGQDELTLVRFVGGEGRFVFPAGSAGSVELDGVQRSVSELVAQGVARPSAELAGAHEVSLRAGGRYRVEVAGLTVQARPVARGRRVAAVTVRSDRGLLAAAASALGLAAFCLGAMHLATADDGRLSQEDNHARLELLRNFMAHAEARAEEQPAPAPSEGAATGAAHAGPSGAMGAREAPQADLRYALRRRQSEPQLAREPRTSREIVSRSGMMDALAHAGPAAATGGLIASPFGGDLASGESERDANGHMNGSAEGDAFGYGGLGPVGSGWGGGGDGRGTVGTGRLGTQGHGNCLPGEECNFGGTRGRIPHSDRPSGGPMVRPSQPVVTGIGPEVIRRVVQRNLGQVNHCYAQGLSADPTLQGRVSVRFVIAPTGEVVRSDVADNNLSVPGVSACIASAVRRWNFPMPESAGVVTVTYPFALMPSP